MRHQSTQIAGFHGGKKVYVVPNSTPKYLALERAANDNTIGHA
ncbi:MAG: hypothetical protein WCY88_11240 [Spongiibacteraceae bacterium]